MNKDKLREHIRKCIQQYQAMVEAYSLKDERRDPEEFLAKFEASSVEEQLEILGFLKSFILMKFSEFSELEKYIKDNPDLFVFYKRKQNKWL